MLSAFLHFISGYFLYGLLVLHWPAFLLYAVIILILLKSRIYCFGLIIAFYWRIKTIHFWVIIFFLLYCIWILLVSKEIVLHFVLMIAVRITFYALFIFACWWNFKFLLAFRWIGFLFHYIFINGLFDEYFLLISIFPLTLLFFFV